MIVGRCPCCRSRTAAPRYRSPRGRRGWLHNPIGITTSQAHRERLLELCRRHRVPLVEDGFEEEMKYFGRVALPIKSMDSDQLVIYLGTFSNVLMPGVRIGWVEELCRSGVYDLHLRAMHRVYRWRMQAMIAALRAHMPRRGARWSEPEGGYLIWVELPGSRRGSQELADYLRARGVVVAPGHAVIPTLSAAKGRDPAASEERGPLRSRRAGVPRRPSAASKRRRVPVMLLALKNEITYGPVTSRRLGRSLGVGLLPAGRKVCTFDCLCCQYGLAPPVAGGSAARGFPSVSDECAAGIAAEVF